MYKYCLFLRGINVNGIKIKMLELTKALNSFGYLNVKTILATGNVILTLDKPIKDYKRFTNDLESKLSHYFAYEAFIFIRDFSSIETFVLKADLLKTSLDCHIYLLILDEARTILELEETYRPLKHTELESLIPIHSDMYWVIEKGNTLVSEFGKKALSNKHFKSKLTSRNMNTIRKIYKQMLL